MSNYIVKNCPAFCKESYRNLDWAITDACTEYDTCCKEIYNCLIKRIIDRCVEASKKCNCKNVVYDIDCFECTAGGNAKIAREILSMFEIEEC